MCTNETLVLRQTHNEKEGTGEIQTLSSKDDLKRQNDIRRSGMYHRRDVANRHLRWRDAPNLPMEDVKQAKLRESDQGRRKSYIRSQILSCGFTKVLYILAVKSFFLIGCCWTHPNFEQLRFYVQCKCTVDRMLWLPYTDTLVFAHLVGSRFNKLTVMWRSLQYWSCFPNIASLYL